MLPRSLVSRSKFFVLLFCLTIVLSKATGPAFSQTVRFLGSNDLPHPTAEDTSGPKPDAIVAAPASTSIGFASADVATATPQTVVASFAVSGYAGSFTPSAIMHYGHDYNVGAANCTTHTSTTETCTFSIVFKPTLPGDRRDALVVKNGTTTLATVLVYGVGLAPLAALNPGIESQTPMPTASTYAYSSAVDENGTAYILDDIGNEVFSYTKAGVLTALPITGLTSPHGIAIDGAGTLYLAQNTYSHEIVTYTADGVQGVISVIPPAPYSPCASSDGGTLEYLYSVAVDGQGDLFALEILCNQIFELKADGSYVTTSLDPTMLQPSNLALDPAGDLFIGGYDINELTADGVQTQVNKVGALEGIAADASGIVYATRYLTSPPTVNFGVAELQPPYATPTIGLEPGNSDAPIGLGLGSDGTVFVGDYSNIDIIDRNAGVMPFGEQNSGVGATQTVQIVNIGNEPLTLSDIAFVDAPGYTVVPSSTLSCSDGIVLHPASYCQISVTLTPTHAGVWNGSLVITSNSLNDPSTSQTVALTGFVYGVYVTPNPTTLAFGGQPVNTSSAAGTVTLSNNGYLYEAEISLLKSSIPGVFTPSLGTCSADIPVGGTCQLSVTFDPAAATSYSGTISATVSSTGGGANQTLTFNVTGTGIAPAATPVFSPAAGSYPSAQAVEITDATSGATIYYTADGTTPTTSSTKYTWPITVNRSETIEAIAVASSYAESATGTALFTIAAAESGSGPLQFIPITPCRAVDTRNPTGPFGGPGIAGGFSREFDLPKSACSIPSTAVAYSLNVTVVPNAELHYITVWPSGQPLPTVSTLNSLDGRIKANAAIVPAGVNGGVSVFAYDATQVILDIDGYFVPAGTASALAFYPVTPCRLVDTRNADGPLGGPFITGGTSRSFPLLSSACGLPATAQAYSLNVTAVPHTLLHYLTAWPTGQPLPVASTLNALTGTDTANAAIVPAGTGGAVSVFVYDDADVVLDVNGYFAPPGTGGLSLYTQSPCRVLDTRNAAGAFTGTLTVAVETSPCPSPSTAQAYVLNATVVPSGPLPYITLWPNGEAEPVVSTLNAVDGAITSNMALVPTTNGSIDAFAYSLTQLILDTTGYFAP